MAQKAYTQIISRKTAIFTKHVREPGERTAVAAINEISMLCASAVREVFTAEGVKSGYRNILMVLGKEDGVSQLTIAKRTGLKPSTISIGLKRMEHDGYIVRTNDDNDLRMTRVYLTEKGLDMCNRAYSVSEAISKVLLENISRDELNAVIAVADKMKANHANSEFAKRDET